MSDTREDRGIELRTVTDLEVRAKKDGSAILAGYASTFNDSYSVHDRFGKFSETILPGAWSESISERGAKIHMYVGHGANPIPLAKTPDSLRLTEDTHGLEFEASINPSRSAFHQDVAYAVESRRMDEMSVGMKVPSAGDRWNDDQSERFISRADLLEISVLGRGANSNTEAGMRNEDILAEIRHLESLLAERGELDQTAKRHLAALLEQRAKLNRRRYKF